MLDPGARWSAPAFHPFYPRLYFLHIVTIFWRTHVLDIMTSTTSSQPYLPRCNTVGKDWGLSFWEFILTWFGLHAHPGLGSVGRDLRVWQGLSGAFIPMHADHREFTDEEFGRLWFPKIKSKYRYQNRWRWFRGGLSSIPALCVLPDVCSSVAESISGSCFSTITP